jgi:hypothetical protein
MTTTQTTLYANRIGYSDITPYEVVRQVSSRTVDIRAMHTAAAAWTRDVRVGGFFAHIANQHDQQWTITPDTDAPIIRIRLGARGWKDNNGDKYVLDASPTKFYDFNF